MPRWAVVLLVSLAAATIALVWLQPAFAGPSEVACEGVSRAVCDRIWREEAAREIGLIALLPVTSVDVRPAHAPYCYQGHIRRLFVIEYFRRLSC